MEFFLTSSRIKHLRHNSRTGRIHSKGVYGSSSARLFLTTVQIRSVVLNLSSTNGPLELSKLLGFIKKRFIGRVDRCTLGGREFWIWLASPNQSNVAGIILASRARIGFYWSRSVLPRDLLGVKIISSRGCCSLGCRDKSLFLGMWLRPSPFRVRMLHLLKRVTRMAFIITIAMNFPTQPRGPKPKGWK